MYASRVAPVPRPCVAELAGISRLLSAYIVYTASLFKYLWFEGFVEKVAVICGQNRVKWIYIMVYVSMISHF